MQKYYDRLNRRLVFVGRHSDSAYWDTRWQTEDFEKLVKETEDKLIVKMAKKYLLPGANVFEGGCGRGDKAYSLFREGYNVYGVDYAKETVKEVNQYAPELKITVGDVAELKFDDNFFDGYWSLGVIEHFYNGYESALREMFRTLKPGGYLFISFPAMSPFRNLKARLGLYENLNGNYENKFFQYAFNKNAVKAQFARAGFQILEERSLSGLKGFKDEVGIFKNSFQKLYDYKASTFIARIFKHGLDKLLSPFFGHMYFMALKKKGTTGTNLTVLFTYGVSLKTWSDSKLIDREPALYRHLINDGYTVNFITYGSNEDLDFKHTIDGINLFPIYTRLKKFKPTLVNLLNSSLVPFRFKEVFKSADIIKTNQMNGSWVGLIAKYLYGKKLVVRCGFEWYRNAYLRRKKRTSIFMNILAYLVEFVVYKLCDEVIISNEADAEFIEKSFGIKKEKIHVIRNYVDTDLFKPLEAAKKEDNKLLYVGRFTPQKNVASLLKAIKNTPYHLDIIGYGEQENELKNFAANNNLNAQFLKLVPNHKLPELLNRYQMIALPSFYEGNPKVILEAMSCGLSVIGTDVPGIREIIKHRENGFLCATDPNSIRNAIEAVMGDKSLREAMGRTARLYILDNYNLNIAAKKEMMLYSKLISRK